MKLLRADQHGHVFHLSPREQRRLLDLLNLYPLVPPAHHRLSRSGQGAEADENQRLLDEALAEQRAENRRHILALLHDPHRFRETPSGFELTLSPAQMEWLLQVLNDVRVGSWLALGEPEPGEPRALTGQNAKYLVAMELCGWFESALLSALGVDESPQWAGE